MEATRELKFEDVPQAVQYLVVAVDELRKAIAGLQAHEPQETEHELLDMAAACRLLMKAESTVYTLCSKGSLPHCKRGKKLYFYKDELLRWIEGGRDTITTPDCAGRLRERRKQVRHKPKSSIRQSYE